MTRHALKRHVSATFAALVAMSATGYAGEPNFLPNMMAFPNPTGVATTYSTTGKVALDGPFF